MDHQAGGQEKVMMQNDDLKCNKEGGEYDQKEITNEGNTNPHPIENHKN